MEGWWGRQQILPRSVYWGMHAACLLGFWITPTRGVVALLAATFLVRMFAITGGYHRYFAHQTFKTSRAFQFVLAVLGCIGRRRRARSGGPAITAIHHKYSDQPGKDVHSPRRTASGTRTRAGSSTADWDDTSTRADPRLRALSRARAG